MTPAKPNLASKFNVNWLFALITHATSFSALLGAFNTQSTTANAAIKAVALAVQVGVTVGVAVTHSKLLTNIAPWIGSPSAADINEQEATLHRVLDEKLPTHTRAVVDSVLLNLEGLLQRPAEPPNHATPAPGSTDAVSVPHSLDAPAT